MGIFTTASLEEGRETAEDTEGRKLGMMTDCEKTKKRGWLRGIKIGCLSLVALVLIIVFVAVGWFFYVTREVEVHDEDLVVTFENVPDEVNGYFALERARNVLEESDFNTEAFWVTNHVPSDQNLKAYRLFVAENPDVLTEFYSVAEYGHCRCPIDEGVPIFMQDIMPVIGVLTLSNLALCHIEFLIREGRDDEALGCLVSHMRIGQMIQNDANNLVRGMIGLVVHKQSLSLLTDYLSQGEFSAEFLPVFKELSVALREGSDWSRMIKAEYCHVKSICSYVSENIEQEMSGFRAEFEAEGENLSFMEWPIYGRSHRFLYNESQTLRPVAKFYHEFFKSVDNPDAQPDFLILDVESFSAVDWIRLYISGNIVGPLIHAVSIPSIANINRLILKQKSKARLIELYSAVWEYHEAKGSLPDELSQLVPKYISELPLDPYGNGAGFLYDPASKVIYSAGVERSEPQDDLRISLGFEK